MARGMPVVFLHSGVGSAGEWKQVLSLCPEGYRLIAVDAYRDGSSSADFQRERAASQGNGLRGCPAHPRSWRGLPLRRGAKNWIRMVEVW